MQAWDDFLAKQEEALGVPTVSRWLRTLQVADFDAGNLYLKAKDSFQILWFDEHIRSQAEEYLRKLVGRKVSVHLSVGKFKPKEKAAKKPTKPEQKTQVQGFQLNFDSLSPQNSFASFIVLDGDRLACKLLHQLTGYDAAAKKMGNPELELGTFNPIYLHGPSGSGKTHLLMAAAQAFMYHGLRALYCRCETFTEHVVTAIRAGEMHQFREAYRNVDVLLIDNVQLFSRKGATQEELFHTFNTLHGAGKLIILAADCPPSQLESIEPRLVSRFEWGIAVPLENASKEELSDLFDAKAAALELNFDNKAKNFLLKTFSSGTHQLTKALEALVLRTHLERSRGERIPDHLLTLPVVSSLIEDLVKEEQQAVLTSEAIISAVAEHYGIRPEDILGKSQSQECVIPRKVAMYLCRDRLGTPFTKIGRTFSRDHSTVMTSVKQVKKQLDNHDGELIASVGGIQKKLQQRH